MDGEDDRRGARQRGERRHDAPQLAWLVDVGRAMQGDEHVLAARTPSCSPRAALGGPALEAAQRVDHRVADEAHAARVDALGGEVRRGLGAVGEQEVGQPVGEDAVDLLGHRPVERAQAGLDVRNRDAELGCRERAGERRVDVATDAHEVGALARAGRARRPRARCAVCAPCGPRADAEEDVGLGELEVRQQLGRHARVVVLPGVDDPLGDVRAASASAAMTGAILTKFGRAPTTWTTRRRPSAAEPSRSTRHVEVGT